MIRNRDEENTTDQERRALDHGSGRAPLRPDSRNLVDPSLHELVHIPGADLRKRAVTPAAVITMTYIFGIYDKWIFIVETVGIVMFSAYWALKSYELSMSKAE